MQRRATAMYVVFFFVIAVGALTFINVVDGPSAAMDESDYDLYPQGTVVIDGTEYQLTRLDEFSATVAFSEEDAELTATLDSGDLVNITGADYRVEIPDVDEPTNVTLVETYPEHNLTTTEDDDGNTLVYVEEDDVWMAEEDYLEQEYGPRDEIFLEVGDTFEFIPEEATDHVEATVDEITVAGVEISWIGTAERTIPLTRDAVNTIDGVDYGTNFVGTEYVQLTTDIEAFEEHREAHNVWAERHQGFWGIGVLSLFAAILIGALSYLPRRR